jgi:hypothetical protein
VAARSQLPDDPLLVAVIIGALVGVAVLAAGATAWGIVILAVAGGLYLLRVEVQRRTGRTDVDGLRRHADVTRRAWGVRSRGQLAVFRARRHLADLEVERARLVEELGEAAYRDDAAAVADGRRRVDDVLTRIAAKEAEIEALLEETQANVSGVEAAAGPPAGGGKGKEP